jgi:type III secretion protein L
MTVPLAYLVDGKRFKLAVEGTIIKGDAFKPLADARALVSECELLAERLRKEGQQALEEAKRRGFEEGRREGVANCAERLAQVEAQAARYIGSLDEKIVRLAVDIVRKIAPRIGAQPIVTELAEHALKEVRAERFLVAKVHPDHHASVARQLEEFKQAYPMIDFVDVLADPELSLFDCVLESEAGVVRADLEVQLDAIERAMRQTIAGRSGAGE